jgi:cbb3-type cytochrome oxidase subunit 3
MTINILEIAGSLGVGAFLAMVIFLMYRQDRKHSQDQAREDRKFMEDRLTALLEKDQKSREENTKALTELTTLLMRMNGKLKQ